MAKKKSRVKKITKRDAANSLSYGLYLLYESGELLNAASAADTTEEIDASILRNIAAEKHNAALQAFNHAKSYLFDYRLNLSRFAGTRGRNRKSGSSTPNRRSAKIAAGNEREKNMKEEMQRIAFTNYAEQFGLKPEWLGKTFEYKGRKFTVAGLNINSKKYPVVTKEGSSFSANYFKMLMTGDQKAYEQGLGRQEYLQFGESYGLKKEWLDKSFVHDGHTHTILGLQFGRSRTKVITRRSDGRIRVWRYAADVVEKMKAAAKAA